MSDNFDVKQATDKRDVYSTCRWQVAHSWVENIYKVCRGVLFVFLLYVECGICQITIFDDNLSATLHLP